MINMDKETLSQYGWIVIVVIILALMLGLASPLASTIGNSISNTVGGFSQKATASLENINLTLSKQNERLRQDNESATNHLNDLNESDYQDSVVKKKVSKYMNQIDDLVEKMEKSETETDLETIYDKSITLYDKIKNARW